MSLMARRRKAGKSALVADREHIHYYLRNRGFSVAATQWTIALANAVCALFAVVGWHCGVPEPVFFRGDCSVVCGVPRVDGAGVYGA